jgi:2-keto-3-deoxy-L-rhamnonate aldolase RhmA
MYENLVKQKLSAGGIAMGVMNLEFATSGIARISAEAGAEFAVYDMEHTGWSLETIKMLVATSRTEKIHPFVRVPTTDYHHIAHALDVGAMGLVIPLVNTAEQAKFVVQCAKYPPIGRRGAAFALNHDDYKGGDIQQKMQHSNDNVFIIAQIETEEAVANVDQIVAVDGIDAVWIGQFDLTTSMGIPGKFDDPKFIEYSKRIVDACHRAGKVATLAVMDVDQLASGPRDGFRLLVYAADLWIYQQSLRRCFRTLRERNGLETA